MAPGDSANADKIWFSEESTALVGETTQKFVTGRLLNWSLLDQMPQVVIVVGAAYEADVDKALALIGEAAQEHEHEHVLDDPAPVLSFEGFGAHSLTLILRAFEHRLMLPTADTPILSRGALLVHRAARASRAPVGRCRAFCRSRRCRSPRSGAYRPGSDIR